MTCKRFVSLFLVLMTLMLGTNAFAATASSTATFTDTAKQNAVFSLVNSYRARYGLKALKRNSVLDRAAAVRGSEISRKFSHTRPNGSSWSTVSPYAYGENIAKGYTSADRVMLGWMNSSGHRANILRSSYGSIGISAVKIGGTWYWVQLFGK